MLTRSRCGDRRRARYRRLRRPLRPPRRGAGEAGGAPARCRLREPPRRRGRRLHAILSEKREEAQPAYIGPFTGKVNAYARILFGPTSGGDRPPDLTVASRTLHGTTVPFGSLSGGAREQLAVLARLACGALVSPAAGDGVPGGR